MRLIRVLEGERNKMKKRELFVEVAAAPYVFIKPQCMINR